MSTSERKRLWTEFVQCTSAHGFINVYRSGITAGRAFWIFAMIFCWGFGTYQVIDTILTYLQYKTTVTVRIQHKSSAVFPAVTVCNLNNIRQSSFANDNALKDMLNRIAHKNETVAKGSDAEMQEEELSKAMVYYELYTQRVDVIEHGHQMTDMLLSCTFQGRHCTADDFIKWQHPTYGNCFTYVVKDSASFPSYAGPTYGLTLTLQVQSEEYLPTVSSAAGFRIQLHAPEYVPFPSEQGITISPGQVTSISFRQKKITRQPCPYGDTDCSENESPDPDDLFSYWQTIVDKVGVKRLKYTNEACRKSCFQIHLLKSCGCIDSSIVTWHMAKDHFGQNNIQIACNYSDMRILMCSRKDSFSFCSDACPQPCHQDTYEYQVTSSLWPRAEYYDRLASAWKARNPNYNVSSYEQATRELVKVELYFQELNYEEITESAAMTFVTVFSSIGGTLGLFAGMSVLTWFEFAELFICWCRLGKEASQDSGQTNTGK